MKKMTIKKYNEIRQKQVDEVLVRNDVTKSKEFEEALGNLFDEGYDVGFMDR